MSKKPINEGIVSRFIDSFFDSYKRGVDKQFIQKSKERNPELAKTLEKVSKDLSDLERMLKNNQ
jgi:hypothetical protein